MANETIHMSSGYVSLDSPNYQPVGITKAENGFIVTVGCKTFVATEWHDVEKGLLEYWDDPIAAEKKYCK